MSAFRIKIFSESDRRWDAIGQFSKYSNLPARFFFWKMQIYWKWLPYLLMQNYEEFSLYQNKCWGVFYELAAANYMPRGQSKC